MLKSYVGGAAALLTLLSMCSTPAAQAQVSLGADASVWSSSVPQVPPILGIGGSGQVNGEFTLNTVDYGDSAFQVGIRASERFVGATWSRVGHVYFVATGQDNSAAEWNYDLHLDFGTSNTDTTLTESLESDLGKTLTPLNMRDYTVEFFFDTDPTAAVNYTVTDFNQVLDDAMVGDNVRLLQSSQNPLFGVFGGGGAFDPDVEGTYDFRLQVRDATTDELIAQSAMTVITQDSPAPFNLPNLNINIIESLDPVILEDAIVPLTLEVPIDNSGNTSADNVTAAIALTLPTGVTLDGDPTATQGSLTPSAEGYDWNVGTVGKGALTATFNLVVDPSAELGPDLIQMSAEITAQDQVDSNILNHSASSSTSITQVIFEDGFESGDTTLWSLTVP